MGLDQYLYLRVPQLLEPDASRRDAHYEPNDPEACEYFGNWEFTPEEERATFAAILDRAGALPELVASGSPHLYGYPDGTVEFCVAYWRKANAIHNWFVKNVQDGVDECQTSRAISPEELAALADCCQRALADPTKASEILPPVSGFFFGSTELDEWYFSELKETAARIEEVIKLAIAAFAGRDASFHYRSSW